MSDARIESKNIALQLLRPIEIVTPDDVDRAVTLTVTLVHSSLVPGERRVVLTKACVPKTELI